MKTGFTFFLKNALLNKAMILYDIGNFTTAITYYDRALAIDPKDKNALEGKGAALSILGNNTGAITYYDRALALDPNFKGALIGKQLALGSNVTKLNNNSSKLKFNPFQFNPFSK